MTGKDKEIFSFLERALFWEGSISAKYLSDKFSLTIEFAKSFLSDYSKKYPANISLDKSSQTTLYPSEEGFLFEYSENNYSNILRTVSEAAVPFIEVLPVIHPSFDENMLKNILRALFKKNILLRIRYQSMNSEFPVERKILPYKLFYIRNRYYIRAFCLKQNDFRDFVLNRIVSISNIEKYNGKIIYDSEGGEYVDIVIKAHSLLSPMQKMCTELEFDMTDGYRLLKVKRSMVVYLLDELRIGRDYYTPPFTVLELHNSSEIQSILF